MQVLYIPETFMRYVATTSVHTLLTQKVAYLVPLNGLPWFKHQSIALVLFYNVLSFHWTVPTLHAVKKIIFTTEIMYKSKYRAVQIFLAIKDLIEGLLN